MSNISLREKIKNDNLSDDKLIKPLFFSKKSNIEYHIIDGNKIINVLFKLNDNICTILNNQLHTEVDCYYELLVNSDDEKVIYTLINIIDDFNRYNKPILIKLPPIKKEIGSVISSVFYDNKIYIDNLLVDRNKVILTDQCLIKKRFDIGCDETYEKSMKYFLLPKLRKYRGQNRKTKKEYYEKQYDYVRLKMFYL